MAVTPMGGSTVYGQNTLNLQDALAMITGKVTPTPEPNPYVSSPSTSFTPPAQAPTPDLAATQKSVADLTTQLASAQQGRSTYQAGISDQFRKALNIPDTIQTMDQLVKNAQAHATDTELMTRYAAPGGYQAGGNPLVTPVITKSDITDWKGFSDPMANARATAMTTAGEADVMNILQDALGTSQSQYSGLMNKSMGQYTDYLSALGTILGTQKDTVRNILSSQEAEKARQTDYAKAMLQYGPSIGGDSEFESLAKSIEDSNVPADINTLMNTLPKNKQNAFTKYLDERGTSIGFLKKRPTFEVVKQLEDLRSMRSKLTETDKNLIATSIRDKKPIIVDIAVGKGMSPAGAAYSTAINNLATKYQKALEGGGRGVTDSEREAMIQNLGSGFGSEANDIAKLNTAISQLMGTNSISRDDMIKYKEYLYARGMDSGDYQDIPMGVPVGSPEEAALARPTPAFTPSVPVNQPITVPSGKKYIIDSLQYGKI